ncbi:4-(cytidine 5'-diphospho)-2-C-methyl-D-erythritol kinase [Synechococcus sp. Nb3U1]|uniref:4-(cytidine 5'-diphospho)-2-C-methyl-D-erythritol kinase n=1 Tax=Synechococcus sp. Nb3U1 TaxID=1914529 RepID=UPI001F3C65DF|nr:4-(cytidine 5'-diphospho)-2-C-methyl-D-erythritol kinase [Synechococcus sp. Nb3U1]MCF2970444.1 4-(cytidine 5'-diphospho)-2-C-methyl-D-erythritol kinase [Synechococcus sp. Nb3U1]
MQACTLIARAKINLYLEILGSRPDGYSEVAMVLQSIHLADRVQLKRRHHGIHLRCDHPEVPTDVNNLAYKAAELLQKECHSSAGVEIHIEKHIPVAAGLAGGSANAAAVLVGMNQLWGLGLTVGDLQSLASRLGSDIPFCVQGGTQLATGRGEILEPLADWEGIPLLLAKPRHLGVSTAWAYQAFRSLQEDSTSGSQPYDTVSSLPQVLVAFDRQDPQALANSLRNDLEKPVLATYTLVGELRSALRSAGALGSLMSGSGPTVFGIMPSLEQASQTRDTLRRQFQDVDFWVTQSAPTGILLEPDPQSLSLS